jgi:hypothetical protein
MDSTTTSQCTDSYTDWAGLIVSILAMNVSWWLLDIPLIRTRGFQHYLKSVAWQCYRLYLPSLAALYALRAAETPQEPPLIYYTGPQSLSDDPTSPRRLSKFRLAKSLLIDAMTIVATGLSIRTATRTPVGTPISGSNSTLWAFPSLPVAIIGLWLLLCSFTGWQRRYILFGGLLVVLAVGLALVLPLALVSPIDRSTSGWFPAILSYVLMALPIMLYARLLPIGMVIVILARVGGVAIGAMTPGAYFPFCPLKSVAFGAVYIAVGSLGGLLAMIAAVTWFGYNKLPPWRNQEQQMQQMQQTQQMNPGNLGP